MTAKERVMLECPECDGTGGSRGSADNMDIEVCYLCDGDGWIWATLTRTWGVTDE